MFKVYDFHLQYIFIFTTGNEQITFDEPNIDQPTTVLNGHALFRFWHCLCKMFVLRDLLLCSSISLAWK